MKFLVKGETACSGVVEGIAKAYTTLHKIPKNLTCDILVIPYFTPLLTPILSKIKGLIVEFGGVMSHAAIIAREFNIPSVVNVKDATKILHNKKIKIENGKIYRL